MNAPLPYPRDLLQHSVGDRSGPLSRLLSERALSMVFQPIVVLDSGAIHAHEALVRGPPGMPLQSPDALLAAARREGLLQDFEVACVVLALQRWVELGQAGRLFVNLSASALVRCFGGCGGREIADHVRSHGVKPGTVVFEITEHEHVADIPSLVAVASELHQAGLSLALDDFGDGRSSLRLWSELSPDVVKIDKYFTRDISQHAARLQTLQALKLIAETFGTTLVAEGVETADDLRALRDLGVGLAQGYFLGRPAALPRVALDEAASRVLADTRVAVLPALRVAASSGRVRERHMVAVPPQPTALSCDEAARLFDQQPQWHALAFVDAAQRPLALLGREQFIDRYAKPFFKEIFGRKPALDFANASPQLVEVDLDPDQLVAVLTSPDQRYLVEGIVYTEGGAYRGLGTGHQLVRQVTETRIEAARHANPLTLLPGNVPVSEHIDRLLHADARFVACYADLSYFKPYNDHYGYWRGDEMIKLLALTLRRHADPRCDLVGHVGGDDFVVLMQSADWRDRCLAMVAEFGVAAVRLYDEAARAAGGIHAEDRHGVSRFFGFTSLYMGVVEVGARSGFTGAADVASAAARAKQSAKQRGVAMQVEAASGAVPVG